MNKSDGYTTGNLLDIGYFSYNYKLTTIDLSKQNQKMLIHAKN